MEKLEISGNNNRTYEKLKLPVGIESFSEICTEGFYYIDKSGMIKELLNGWGKVNLFTRPRRFGKSLNMSMLKAFFEVDCEKTLFEGLQIAREKEICDKYMGKFPVISISLKGVSGDSFENARSKICSVIGKEAMRFQFLLDSSELTEKERALYNQLTVVDEKNRDMFTMPDSVLSESLQTLSLLLQKHYGHKVIILIDEYDVPLDKAYQCGYYDAMVKLIRDIFIQALKSNDSLYFAVLTGCLRISKESIFTGLNNPQVFSITDAQFAGYFGFTDEEVKELLTYYHLADSYEQIRDWYDGYHFGNTDVYCPWDVVSYCAALRADSNALPKDYWSNTSSNNIVKQFIQRASKLTTKREIEGLIAGESIAKKIYHELTYKDLDKSVEYLWSLLFATGYLTQLGTTDGDTFRLCIPNLEIRKIYTEQVYTWFQEMAEQDGKTLNMFCEALQKGDAVNVEKYFNAYLMRTISIRDTFVKKARKENFYHGILLGLVGYKENWSAFSNKETGEGYSDIIIEIDEERVGIIIEVKYSDEKKLEESSIKALEQIRKLNYEEQLLNDGMKTILKYGIACYKKYCRVRCEIMEVNV